MENRKEKTDSDGFKHVSYKRKKKKNSKSSALHPIISFNTVTSFDKTSLDKILNELKYSDFMTNFKETFLCVLEDWDSLFRTKEKASTTLTDLAQNISSISLDNTAKNVGIVCYGLGKFTSCIIARYQLGFLMLLKNILETNNLSIYDPQFSCEEIQILKDLGVNVLRLNEEGKRKIATKTIFFMPHCDLPLYNNLLWANWNKRNLARLMIIGNSFQNYQMNDSRNRLKEKANYVCLANQFVTEMKVRNCFEITDIFNDLAIHYFKSDALMLVTSDVWTELQEPEYSDGDDIIKCSH